ncbi:hypothetical protein TREMEDRAFT_63425 [Tremella mesenterica DSM 1558]|uniref:uncharacterized protein n=1 Tax=Tremella mesenterica (strain ATCC 24925 / CBS 8224 / DSM 1558 / NBRC 9311 / NRRL Y-6157 / RJB 2259-6 / UBC 559-6) TaxID=578456 RepID=UPI0003F49F96|nr:uncharacterized protein TREMEDRAFT_63425 [Tremella mesenterica DSM 1558]EIW68252.1 hypothetical protein TREMEDRAFT_63425 [Tremella mesenterica DSM 1558]
MLSARLFPFRPSLTSLAASSSHHTSHLHQSGSLRAYATTPTDSKGSGKQSPTDSPEGEKATKHDASHANPRPDHQGAVGAARDEIRGITRDVAELISGKSGQPPAMAAMEQSSHSHGSTVKDDFYEITTSIVSSVPKPALYFGLAGTLPYLGTSLATVYLARQAALAAAGEKGYDLASSLTALHTVEHVQITYGAIILSFLGAIHWGMEFAQLGGAQGYRRLALGVIPVLLAWPTTFLSHGVALATQWTGFTLMWFLDQRASTIGWTTSWYSTYRFYLSIIVGFSIIGTFAGTGYYGAGAGAVSDANAKHSQHTTERVSPVARLNKIKVKDTKGGKLSGQIGGEIALEENETGEGYGKLRNIRKEEEAEEEERQKEEEEKEKAKQEENERQDEREASQIQNSKGIKKGQKSDKGMKSAGGQKGDKGDKAGAEIGEEDGDESDETEGNDEKGEDEGKDKDQGAKTSKKGESKQDKDDKEGEQDKEDEGGEKNGEEEQKEGEEKTEGEKKDAKKDDKEGENEGKKKEDKKQEKDKSKKSQK